MNDECRRTSTLGADENVWGTLYNVPPLSVDRPTYLAVRATALAAAVNAIFLCVIGVITIRSRTLGVKLLGVFAIAQLVLMLAMVLAAHRFSAALDAFTAGQVWFLGKPYGSATRGTALVAALPGVAYPLVLLWLFIRHRDSARRRRGI